MTQLRLDPNGPNETLLTADFLVGTEFNKTHTGISDYRIQAAFDKSLEDRALENIWLEKDDGSLLFRGLLEIISSTESNGSVRTTLRGHGPAHRLETSEVVYTVSNQLAHNAIEDFWANETAFTPTVTQPSISNTVTGEVAQEADTTSEFGDILSTGDEPVAAQNGNIELLQTCFTQEFEDSTANVNANSNASGGFTGNVGADTDASASFTFETGYTIPADEFDIALRYTTGDSPDDNNFEWFVDGESLGTAAFSTIDGFAHDGGIIDTVNVLSKPTSDLDPGVHTVSVEYIGSGSDDMEIDTIAPLDQGDRFGGFNYTFDNDNGGSDGYLDGPELYPDAFTKAINSSATSWNITDGTLTTTWDDTSNNQNIQLRLDGQTYFPNDGSEDNTSTVTTTFGSEVGNALQGRATFSRYGSRSTATPQTGFNGQKLQSWEIKFDGNDLPVFGDVTFEGTQLDVAQDLHQKAGMRFVIEHEKNSLPVYSFRAGDVTRTLPTLDELSRTTKADFSEYFNDVTVRGQREGGTRLSHNVNDSTEISSFGERHFDRVDPSLNNLNAIKVAARQLLIEKIKERDKKGTLTIAPENIPPGFSYDNPFDTGTIPIEEVMYSIRNGDIQGELVFDFRVGELQLGEDIGSIRRNSRNSRLGF